jgi:iron(III) transport system permease protein
VAFLTLAIVLMPLMVLLWASLLPYYQGTISSEMLGSLTLDNYVTALGNSGITRAVWNTLVVCVATGVAVMAIATATAWVMMRTRVPGRQGLDFLASLPLVIPGIVAGIAVLRTYINWPLPIYGTVWILVIAYTLRYIPYGMRYAHSGIIQMHSDLEESAAVSGASLGTRFRRIVLPLILPALAGGFIFTFLNSSSQLAIPLLLSGPESQVISVQIFDLYQNGAIAELAAFSILVTIVIVALARFAYQITRSFGL